MAALGSGYTEEPLRSGSSPKPKGRENAKDTLCRNVTIYGHCRYEDRCAFNHDPVKSAPFQTPTDSLKKRFNADSPSFTPASLVANGNGAPAKTTGLSSRAASAAPFRPKNHTPVPNVASPNSSSLKPYNPNAPDWLAPDVPDFVPNFHNLSTNDTSTDYSQSDIYFDNSTGISTPNNLETQPQSYNYTSSGTGFGQQNYMPNSSSHSQLLLYHLYAPLGNSPENIPLTQRTAKDVFIPEDLRHKLQKKSEASLRTFPNSQSLPPFQYLTPLEAGGNSRSFVGTASTVFKAVSDVDAKLYCLRRLHDTKVTKDNEAAIAAVKGQWSQIHNSNVVSVKLAWSTLAFGTSSVMIMSDYHPDSTTLHERLTSPYTRRGGHTPIPEHTIWTYVAQIANALKAIHSASLAASVLDAHRWLVTDEKRIRYNACGIANILNPNSKPEEPHAATLLVEQQRSDLTQFGKLVTFMVTANNNSRNRTSDSFPRYYSPRLKEAVDWLSDETLPQETKTIDILCQKFASEVMTALDSSLRLDDALQHHLNRELENGRIARLLFKINVVIDRSENENDRNWSAQGPRAIIGLFRDYVFHQVDAQGNPVIDMGHMLACLNKLDAGLDEKITLTSRDNKTLLVVSFRELKPAVESAFVELTRRQSR